jgi:ADP-ribose pyrophosphatase
MHAYLATDLRPSKQALEDDEVLSLVEMPFEDALELARRGEIKDAKTIATLFMAEPRLKAPPTDGKA